MDFTYMLNYERKATCANCGHVFKNEPILGVKERVGETHWTPHTLCPKCLYLDCIKYEDIKRKVPLIMEDLEWEDNKQRKHQEIHKILKEHALFVDESQEQTTAYVFKNEKYKKGIDDLIFGILVYLEDKEIQRRFANLTRVEKLIKKYEDSLEHTKNALTVENNISRTNYRNVIKDLKAITGGNKTILFFEQVKARERISDPIPFKKGDESILVNGTPITKNSRLITEKEYQRMHNFYTEYFSPQSKRDFEYILCAANWYTELKLMKDDFPNTHLRPVNCKKGIVFCAKNHLQCMYQMIAMTGKNQNEAGKEITGFLTNKNRFVNRKEAMKIAIEAYQVNKRDLFNSKIGLFSEDLY